MIRETLRCRCGGEVGIVRLNAETLTFGHKVNPRNHRHAVRLARSADGRTSLLTSRDRREDNHRQTEGQDPSSRTPNRTRPAGNGRPRTASPSEVIEPSSGARERRAVEPPSRSVSGSAGVSTPTAGEGAE